MGKDDNNNNLTDFRLTKLEEAIEKIADALIKLKDIIAKYENLEEKIKNMETELNDLKKFFYKSVGALVVISFIIQLLAPVVLDKVLHPASAQIEYIQK